MLIKYLGPSSKHESEHLQIGHYYVVYWLLMPEQWPPFLCLGKATDMEVPLPSCEMVDDRLSRYWSYRSAEWEAPNSIDRMQFFGFPEYVRDNEYRHALVDGEIAAEQLFDSYANLMDREFPLPWVEAKGTDLGDGWVQCGICQDAFQANRQDAMAFCDKCNKLIHNPLYESPTLPGIGPRH